MSSPASNDGATIGSSDLVASALASFILAPVLHGLACLVLIAIASLAMSFASVGLGVYLGWVLPIAVFYSLKSLYVDHYIIHPILCFVVLPAIVMTAADHGWTLRTLRFALYLGAAAGAAMLVHLSGSSGGLAWLAALGGLSAVAVFETTPRLIRQPKLRCGS